MGNEPKQHEDDETSTGDEISQDALGDTHLGKNLGHLIREIGRQHKKVLERADTDDSSSTEKEDSDTADRMERLNDALEVVAASKENSRPSVAFVDHDQKDESTTPSAVSRVDENTSTPEVDDGDPVGKALSEIEATLRRFADAERRRREQEISGWRAQFKKAAMIVIKKQVEAARANWIKKSSENEAKVAEHYRKLKLLADKVAKQKVEIQKAKQELKEKLEIADRLHVEFDGIRQVLDGKLGVLDELEEDEDQD